MRTAVVKLGGSTAYHAEMRDWVAVLAAASMPLVIVPGGGRFADAVRAAQPDMGFSDRAAHFMAILAMEQMGIALLDMDERLVAARSPAEIASALDAGRTPVWLPARMCSEAADIPASWDVTSDSLAAWLAGRVGAEALLLIKQTDAFDAVADMEGLAEARIVDPMLASMLPAGVELYVAGPRELAVAHARLAEGLLPGRRFARRVAERGAA